jgi:hypothetical protein
MNWVISNTFVKGSTVAWRCSMRIILFWTNHVLGVQKLVLRLHQVAQQFKKVPAFYGTSRYTVMFTRSSHLALFWAKWIKFTLSHPISLRSILILSITFRFSVQKFVCNSHDHRYAMCSISPCLIYYSHLVISIQHSHLLISVIIDHFWNK